MESQTFLAGCSAAAPAPPPPPPSPVAVAAAAAARPFRQAARPWKPWKESTDGRRDKHTITDAVILMMASRQFQSG